MYLSLGAILRDEAPYVEEWVRYHSAQGIEHFYLYENDSQDNTLEILQELKKKFSMTLHQVHGSPIQLQVYNHCVEYCKHQTRWLTIIDGDEFIVPKMPLQYWLRPFESYAGVVAHWYLFGSNGHKDYLPLPVVERFTRRQADVNPHFKCFINPKQAIGAFTPHRFHFREGSLVDEHGHTLASDQVLQYNGTADDIQINHYATKSLAECYKRRQTARGDTGEVRAIPEFFKGHDRNDVEDTKARDFWRTITHV